MAVRMRILCMYCLVKGNALTFTACSRSILDPLPADVAKLLLEGDLIGPTVSDGILHMDQLMIKC